MRRAVLVAAAVFGCLSADRGPVEWASWGGDPGGTHYSTLAEINTANVAQLRPAWIWKTGETELKEYGTRPGMFENTPVMIDDVLYVTTPYNRVVALNAETGAELWSYDPKAYVDGQPANGTGFVHRGIAVWRDARDGNKLRIFLNTRYRLISIDAKTGQAGDVFGDNGVVDLSQGLVWPINKMHYTNTSPPVVYKDLVIVGNGVGDRLVYKNDPPGDVRAFDVRTGKQVWTLPHDSAGRRIRQRHLGQRFLEVHRPHQRVGADHARRGARPRLSARQHAEQRLLRRQSPRRQPVRRIAGVPRRANRRAQVALPDRSSRPVGLRSGLAADLVDDHRRRPKRSTPSCSSPKRDSRSCSIASPASRSGRSKSGRCPRATFRASTPRRRSRFRPSRPPFSPQGVTLDDAFDLTPELKAEAQAEMKKYRLGPLFTPPSLRRNVDASRHHRRRQLGRRRVRSGDGHAVRQDHQFAVRSFAWKPDHSDENPRASEVDAEWSGDLGVPATFHGRLPLTKPPLWARHCDRSESRLDRLAAAVRRLAGAAKQSGAERRDAAGGARHRRAAGRHRHQRRPVFRRRRRHVLARDRQDQREGSMAGRAAGAILSATPMTYRTRSGRQFVVDRGRAGRKRGAGRVLPGRRNVTSTEETDETSQFSGAALLRRPPFSARAAPGRSPMEEPMRQLARDCLAGVARPLGHGSGRPRIRAFGFAIIRTGAQVGSGYGHPRTQVTGPTRRRIRPAVERAWIADRARNRREGAGGRRQSIASRRGPTVSTSPPI